MAVPIARDALLVATSATPSYASSVMLLDAAQPAPQTPLLQLRLQQQPHSVGPERLAFLPTRAPALAQAAGAADGAGDGAAPVHAGVVVSGATNKPAVALHSFQSPQQLAQLFLPTPATCLGTNPVHSLLAAGGQDGCISVWDMRSGELLANAFDAHYQPVSLLRWTGDGQALISAGEDGRICVWTLASIIDPASLASGMASTPQPIPWAVFSDHTLGITSLVHQGSFPGHVFSASLDGTVKRFNLTARRAVSTFAFPVPVGHIQVDDLGRYLLACTQDATTADGPVQGSNTLYRVDMYCRPLASSADSGKRRKRSASAGAAGGFQPVGALGAHAVHRVDPTEGTLLALSDAVSSMALAPTGPQAVLGTVTGKLHFVDVASLRVLRTVSLVESLTASGPAATQHAKLPPVSAILSLRTPADLHASSLPAGAEAGTPSSLVSPVQAAAVRALRAAGRVRAPIPPPVVPARLDRVTRAFATAHALSVGGAPGDRPIRVAGAADPLALVDSWAPGFFAQDETEDTAREDPDIIPLDSERKQPLELKQPLEPTQPLELPHEDLRAGLAEARALNDQLWGRVQRLEAQLAQRG